MNKNLLLLIIIFSIGIILRFYKLGEIPVSLHRDEVFLGYNAYSILKTGKDISGHFLPIHLESFFFSPAGYSYFSIPFIALFGLSEFSTRFASALLGSLTVIMVFLIAKNLFEKNKKADFVAILSAFFFAISPWSINLSRTATENTIVVFFIILGIFLYLKYLNKRDTKFLFLSFFSFGVNSFIYQAPRVFMPIFIPFMVASFDSIKNLFKSKILIGLYIFFIVIPVVLILTSPNLSLRIKSLSIFQHPEVKLVVTEQTTTDSVLGVPYVISRAFHNKAVGYTLVSIDNFFKHLSFDFLFSDQGFPDRYRIPDMGLLYVFELPLILLGLYSLFNNQPKVGLFLSGWIAISILGSALTYDDVPNLQRTLIAVPAFSILSGYGLVRIFIFSKKYGLIGKSLMSVFALIIVFNFLYYIIQYYFQGQVYRTWYRQDGYQELVRKVNNLLPNYGKAVVTSRETAPTIFFLFYSRYDPLIFQNETRNVDMRKSDHVSYNEYKFSEEECPLRIDSRIGALTGEKETLYVNSSLCKDPKGTRLLDVIKRVDGSEVFRMLDLHKI